MKRQRLAVFVFWASLVLLVVCSSLAVNRPRRVSTGILGEAVSLGMGVDEVLRAAGTPDWAYSESGWRRGICVFSYHREVLGRPATVSYTFNDRRESKNARVTEASVRMEFDTRAECDRAMEALCGHYREWMRGEPRFDEYTRDGPVRAWDSPQLLQTCTLTSARRGVIISRTSCRVWLTVRA